METVLIVLHLIIVLAMAGVILLQRSEGGALGMGGGGNSNFMSSRGKGDVLTRTTTILAIGFFVTSISLGILANYNTSNSFLGGSGGGGSVTVPEIGGGEGGILDDLGGLGDDAPAAPAGPQAPTGQ